MSKKKHKPLSTTDEIWDKSRFASVILYGFENRSRYINELIEKDFNENYLKRYKHETT